MHRHGDIIAKRMVVEDVDTEEKDNVDEPAANWNFVRGQEEGRPRPIKLGNITRNSYEEELNKRKENPYSALVTRRPSRI